jgi:hypothetical protein
MRQMKKMLQFFSEPKPEEVGNKFLVLNTLYKASTIRHVLTCKDVPVKVYILGSESSAAKEFALNNEEPTLTQSEIQITMMPNCYDSIENAKTAIAQYNSRNERKLFEPYIMELNNIQETQVSEKIFKNLTFDSIGVIKQYNFKDDSIKDISYSEPKETAACRIL